ncbi:hypothetical protein S7711_10679 [Stachybotrys chartarum IBT 7711]|uniref:Uncharacterized protein n=1 Tax=Stachybotrys chartarum (strain CBS 109288 / IBT 7711) TaxID=1280523 RepID=A0A084AWP7_STACB|nr:hypothetical protein S7711_10679 [Stachybotrys chartarum IBT 7711]KFA49382.1 hypothetical protein S40293_10787 [Stachybotrys chartarum IBT 40293]KFA80526.1 hypothetical protein S40288_10686 [Stachybotrys chartarum IBT 40288]
MPHSTGSGKRGSTTKPTKEKPMLDSWVADTNRTEAFYGGPTAPGPRSSAQDALAQFNVKFGSYGSTNHGNSQGR